MLRKLVMEMGPRLVFQSPKICATNPTCIMTSRGIGLKSRREDNYAGTMDEVRMKMMKRIGVEPGYQLIQKSREHLLQYTPKPEDLPTRNMQDSFSSAIIPLGTDKNLQDRYIQYLGGIRLGRLMEDMDMFAVWACHQHIVVPSLPEGVSLPYTFVTILVDKITVSPMSHSAAQDVRISGHVSYVGRSTLEVVVWLEQMEKNEYKKITRALFLMAARNATNTGPAPVNQLVAATDEEAQILKDGVHRTKRRRLAQERNIFKVEPNDYEQTLMYQIFQRTTPQNTLTLNNLVLPSGCKWMSDTLAVNTVRGYPENRNAHNKVFGGFLMRHSLEISHMATCMYSKQTSVLRVMSDINFAKPVSVDSLIRFYAYIIYTEKNYMQVMVVADVLDSRTNEQVTTNTFFFTYESPQVVPEVLPRTYQEMIWYIHGRRKFRCAMGLEDSI